MVRKCLFRVCNLILIASLLVGFLPKAEAEVILPIEVSDSYKSGPYYTNLINTLEKYANAPMAERLVQVALSQKGYRGGASGTDLAGTNPEKAPQAYTEYYRWISNDPDSSLLKDWCASFVSWSAAAAGIPESIIKKWAGCGGHREMALSNGTAHKIWDDTFTTYIDYEPRVGDLVLYMPTHEKNEGGCGEHENSWEESAHIVIVAEVLGRTDEGGWKFKTIERANNNIVGQNVVTTHDKRGTSHSCQCNGAQNAWVVQMFISPPWADYIDKQAPNVSNFRVSNIADDSYTVICNVQDDVQVKSVVFKTWSESSGEAAAVSHTGTLSGHSASVIISKSRFPYTASDTIYTSITATDASGNSSTYTQIDPYQVNRQPVGYMDVAEGEVNALHIAGWAKDPDASDEQVTLHVYVGGEAGSGAPGYSIVANNYREDLGGWYGFDDVISLSSTGYQPIYIYALDTDGGVNPLIGAVTVGILENPAPDCEIEVFEWTDSGLHVKGVVWDPDEPDSPIDIHVYEGAPAGGDVQPIIITADTYGGLDGTRFVFDELIPVAGSGDVTFYLYSINRPIPSTNICFDIRTVSIPVDTTPPTISDVQISDISCEGYTVTCRVTDIHGISKVAFPTWSTPDQQDDLAADWADTALGVINADGTVTFRVNTRSHGHQTACSYVTHIYAWDHAGNVSSVSDEQYSQLKVDVPWPVLDVNVSDVSPAGYKVSCALDPAWNPTTAIFPTWTVDNGQDDLDPNWSSNALGSINSDGTVTYQVYTANHGGQIGCEYITHIYLFDDMGNQLLLDDGTFSLLRLSVPFMMDPDVVLPESLLVIDAEAFCGLPVKTVYCNSGLTTINENAFANCAYLTGIYLPVTVTHIDPTAFSGCPSDLIIFAVINSHAAQFSQDYGYSLIEVSE